MFLSRVEVVDIVGPITFNNRDGWIDDVAELMGTMKSSGMQGDSFNTYIVHTPEL
jgi:hypothetical protein